MDGCLQPWLLGCVIDWDAWGAIGTMLATVVALYLGLAAFRREEARRKQLARAHASSMRIRLGALIANFARLERVAENLSGYDPSASQLASIAKEASLGATLVTWGEAAELAAHDPSLGAKVFGAIEVAIAVAQMAQWEFDNHTAPEFAELRKKFIGVLGQAAQKGKDLAEQATEAIDTSGGG